MTDYLTGTNRWGEKVFDMAAFAKDLAAALGGKVRARDPERSYDTRDDIEMDGVRLGTARVRWLDSGWLSDLERRDVERA